MGRREGGGAGASQLLARHAGWLLLLLQGTLSTLDDVSLHHPCCAQDPGTGRMRASFDFGPSFQADTVVVDRLVVKVGS